MAPHEGSGPTPSLRGEKAAPSSRGSILEAAVRVAVRDGIVAMTLDAVAKEAGVSKGGLIYHFRTKDDLIAAMLEDCSTHLRRAVEARVAADDIPRGRWFRAFVHAVLLRKPGGDTDLPGPPEMSRFLPAVLVASANNPRLLDPVRQTMGRLRERLLADEANGMRQVALWPAIYGLLLWQHLGVMSPDDPLYQSILDELLALAEGPEPLPPGQR
jgi:AcrR family transcriptional regulator